MAKQVLNMMERLSVKDTGFILEYIRDAFTEIQELIEENESILQYIDIVNGVELYNFPEDMIRLTSLRINDNDELSYNKEKWQFDERGRKFVLKMKNTEGDFDTPSVSVSNGIELRYTKNPYIFVKNPDGDSNYYDYTTAQTSAVTVGQIVYVADGVRADYAERYHYYERKTSTLSSTALSGVDYTDTDYWTDVTELTTPDEESYINCSDTMFRAIEQYIRMKIADSGDDIQKAEYRKLRFNIDVNKTEANRIGIMRKGKVLPEPYSLT